MTNRAFYKRAQIGDILWASEGCATDVGDSDIVNCEVGHGDRGIARHMGGVGEHLQMIRIRLGSEIAEYGDWRGWSTCERQ